MQFGIFTVGDVTTDPTTGRTPTEAERIKAMVTIAKKAEEVGLDVFATGEHHNRPFVPSSPTTMLAYVAASTSRLLLSTSTTLITTNDPVKIAEDYAMLQHLADGRVDLMMGRGNTGPVYPWFGRDIRDGIELAVENYALLRRLWTEDVVDWAGKFRTPLQGFTSTPRPLDGVPPFVWHGSIRSPEIAEQAAYYGDGFFANHIFWPTNHFQRLIGFYRDRYEHHGHGTRDQAIVGLGGQAFIRPSSQDAVREFRPYFDNAPVYGHGPALEDFMRETPLTVGSPAGDREDADVPGALRRLPAPALPRRPRRAAAQDRPRAARHPGRAGRAGAAPGDGRPASGARPGRPDARVARARRAADRRAGHRSRVRRAADLDGACGMTRRIVVLSAGLGSPSSSRLLADRLAAAASHALGEAGEQVEVEVVEVREHAVDLAHQLVTGFPSTRLGEVLERVAAADAVVAVSPVFNASYSGLFKMFLDALPVGSLDGVPVLLGATGGSTRHSLVVEHALRPLFAYLRATTTATGVFAATEDWASPGELDARIERAGRELAVLVAGSGRARPATVDPYDVSAFSFARFDQPVSA